MISKEFIVACILFAYITLVSGGNFNNLDVNKNLSVNTENENPTPIFGILAQELSKYFVSKFPNKNYTSYIATSYVKFVEGAGGRVVPIWIGKSRDYYWDILSKINGVLLPGGVVSFEKSNGYADAGRYIYEFAMELNDNGTHFPVWGTCLGFQLFLYLSANSTEPRILCSSKAQALPLEFTEGYEKSRLFCNASTNIIDIFKNYPVTVNSHKFCVTRETFAQMKLHDSWNILSVNHDWDGIEFISTIEHKKYPFYALQFHPEKNLYEFKRNRNITHSARSIETSQYFANFLVNEARRNCHQFTNKTEEDKALIYNYAPVYTGLVGSSIIQEYMFEPEFSSSNTGIKLHLYSIIISILSGLSAKKFCL